MKITLYTVTDCQFSKQEKDYLTAHSLLFEEKNLETNRDFLTEMLAVSNNFAGTPVTKIEKDDGQIVILKGFTQEEFDKTLGFAQPQNPQPQVTQTPAQMQAPSQNQPLEETPSAKPTPASLPQQPQVPQTPQNIPTMSPPPPPAPVQMPEPPAPPQPPQPNPMNTVLNNLQNQASTSPPLPNIPDPKL